MRNHSVSSIIEKWPALSEFARDAGVTYGAAKQMKRRGSIPVEYWPSIIRSASVREIGLVADDLMAAHAAPSPTEASA